MKCYDSVINLLMKIQIMRLVRIYQPGDYKQGDVVELSATQSQHVGTVLRMQEGEPLILFPGNNCEYAAVIIDAHKKKVSVRIDTVTEMNRESPRGLHLAQAISKGERMEFVIQKAVELGVTSITPLLTTRCVVRLDSERMAKKQAQWQAIAVAACEQSGRNMLPVIHPICTMSTYLQSCQAVCRWILSPLATLSLHDYALPMGDIALLIGPEGGLTDDEIITAEHALFQPLYLGPRILRTETAAIAAISILQALGGDL